MGLVDAGRFDADAYQRILRELREAHASAADRYFVHIRAVRAGLITSTDHIYTPEPRTSAAPSPTPKPPKAP